MKTGSRYSLLLLCNLILLLPSMVFAADYHLTSDTLLRFFERDVPGKDNVQVLPFYEYIQADVGGLKPEGLSFHLYGWGRTDLGERDFFEENEAGELLYGYLRYARPNSNLDLRAGRIYVFEGVANEVVDGVRIGSDLGPRFYGSVYGGFPVALDSEQGRDGDGIFGGRIAHRMGKLNDVGISFKSIHNDGDLAEERIGGDLFLTLPAGIDIYGFSSYNLDSQGWAEHSYEVHFQYADFSFNPFLRHFVYEDFFATGDNSANPFRFLAGTGETLTLIGVDTARQVNENWDLGVRIKHYVYDLRDDSSFFLSGLANWHGENMTSAGGEIGYMDGDTDETRFLMTRVYFYLDGVMRLLPRGFVTGELVLVGYGEEIESTGKDHSLFLSLGAGRRYLKDALEIKLSGDYSSDPFFDHDIRGLLAARFTFDR